MGPLEPTLETVTAILQKYNDVVFPDEWGEYLYPMGDNPYIRIVISSVIGVYAIGGKI